MTTDSYLTVEEVAEYLRVSPRTVRYWCRSGRFAHAQKFGSASPQGHWRIPESDLTGVKAERAVERPERLDRKRRNELLTKLG